ncbi:5-oxoproline transporter, DUF979 family subunit [Klebsiella quasipneumoniae subsp. similipneumoniae]
MKRWRSQCEARRLLDSVGWAFILPQILAVLGCCLPQRASEPAFHG